MVQVEYIRWLYYQQHESVRAIARKLGHSRKTVRKVLALEDPREHKYPRGLPKPQPVMGPVEHIIETWLREDENKPRKQRHTARRIYQRLKEEYGFRGSEVSVRRAVRLMRQRFGEKEKTAYIPLEFALGEAAQCDWGEAWIVLGGQLTKVYIFCMRLCASRAIFVRAYLHQRQEAFFEGHRLAFEFFGGVPKRVICDNLKTAVRKVLEGARREEQEAFVALRSHYVFAADFTNVRRAEDAGYEKHVPEIEAEGDRVTVRVGSAPHPMEEKHYIEWIELEADGVSQRVFLTPGQEPVARFCATGESSARGSTATSTGSGRGEGKAPLFIVAAKKSARGKTTLACFGSSAGRCAPVLLP